MATAAPNRSFTHYTADQAFFLRSAIVLSAIIVFGFAQWTLRGFVVPSQVPIWIHLHALAMLGWLGLFITQNALAGSGNIALHRRLGWASVGLVGFIVALGMFSGRMALRLHHVPPFFTDAYFLALTHFELVIFPAMFIAAIALRRQTEWHRRLMLGATVILMEPALGRMVPMPLVGVTIGTWIEASFQLLVLVVVARHDRKTLGHIHPATLVGMAAVIGTHAIVIALAASPTVIALAQTIATGA